MEQKMAHTMIKTAVNKGFQDIEENPKRGIRNMVDLGEYFVGEGPGNQFFRWAQDELGNPNSLYYNYVEAVVRNVAHDTLTNFFINFGYNSLVHGGEIIKKLKATEDIHIPWLLMLDNEVGRPEWLPLLESLIRQGKELGIYSYYFKRPNMHSTNHILNIAEHEKDCAFFLHISKDGINDILIERVAASRNIFILLELETSRQAIPEVADALLRRNCLYGGIMTIDSETQDIYSRLKRAAKEGFHTLFLIGENEDYYPQCDSGHSPYSKIYYHEDMPVLVLNALKIAFNIDSGISGKSCLGFINGEGNFTYIEPDSCIPSQRCNVTDWSLKEIFAAAAPDCK